MVCKSIQNVTIMSLKISVLNCIVTTRFTVRKYQWSILKSNL